MELTEREEIELATLLMAGERESLGELAVLKSCNKCGKSWLKGEHMKTDGVERIHNRHPDIMFVQFYITDKHDCHTDQH